MRQALIALVVAAGLIQASTQTPTDKSADLDNVAEFVGVKILHLCSSTPSCWREYVDIMCPDPGCPWLDENGRPVEQVA